MTVTVTDRVEYILAEQYDDRVYDVSYGTVWVSLENDDYRTLTERMVRDLHNHGIPCGPIHDENAERYGGAEFRFGNPHGVSLHPEDNNLPGHHAVGETTEAFESSGHETPVVGAGGGGGVVLVLAAAAIAAFALGLVVGWLL